MKKRVSQLTGLVLSLMLVLACAGPQGTATPLPTSTPTPAPTATPTPIPAPLTADQILSATTAAMAAAKSYHFVLLGDLTLTGSTVSLPGPVQLNATGDFQAPDRVQSDLSIVVAGTPVQSTAVVIGNTAYVKNPLTGEWITQSGTAGTFQPEQFANLEAANLTNLKLVGEEPLAGTPSYHLSATSPFSLNLGQPVGDVQGQFDTNYWVDVQTDRLLQAQVQGSVPLTGTVQATVGLSMTINFSNYDENVNIQPPVTPTP